MLTPLDTVILTVFINFIVAPLSHVIVRLPKVSVSIAKVVCILTAYLSLLLVYILIPVVYYNPIRVHLFSLHLPIGTINVGLYVDYLSIVPAFISSLFTALALTFNVYYLSPYNRAYKISWEFNRSYSFILLFNGAMLGILFSDNLLSLLIFWEIISLCSYALISFWNNDEQSLIAAIKALIMKHIGGLALLITVIIIYSVAGTLEIPALSQKISINDPITYIILSLLLISALPKMVLYPFHTWLPDATIAPSSTILIFHEGGTLAGIYIIIRFFLDIFRTHTFLSTPVILHPIFGNMNIWGFIFSIIGSITLLLGALNGIIEDDLKRIAAYGTISGLGYIAIAIGLSTPLSITAALFLMISHAFTFGLLFLCIGSIVYSTGKYNINHIEGLYQQMPITTLCCLTGVLSMSTAPLFSEFAGKYLVFSAIIDAEAPFFIIIAFFGCVLNAATAIRMFYSIFLRRTDKTLYGLSTVKDPNVLMIFPMILMSIIVVIFGVTPTTLLNLFVLPIIRHIFSEELMSSIVLQQDFIKTPIGFWNPIVTAISIILLLTLFTLIIIYSKKVRLAYRALTSKEAIKPFVCGENSKILGSPKAYDLYHTLLDVLRIEGLCYAINIDRAYTSLSNRFFSLTEKMRRLDIQQKYFSAVLSFIFGALIMIVLAVLAG